MPSARCPRCKGALLANYGELSCLNCGYEPLDGVPHELEDEYRKALVLRFPNLGRDWLRRINDGVWQAQ